MKGEEEDLFCDGRRMELSFKGEAREETGEKERGNDEVLDKGERPAKGDFNGDEGSGLI